VVRDKDQTGGKNVSEEFPEKKNKGTSQEVGHEEEQPTTKEKKRTSER